LGGGDAVTAQYIPSGRTSLVKRGKLEFQLQTEYAAIPQPRVTTTIFAQGRVLHKIEKAVSKAIDSIEEMHRIEDLIKAQHIEVSKSLRDRGLPTVPESRGDVESGLSRLERMRRLEEVERVFLVSSEGKIVDDRRLTKEFKRLFKHIFKELPSLITVFASLPDSEGRREEGFYEIEPGRVLLASTGAEFYLMLIRPGTAYTVIKEKVTQILSA
jgi:hypothetical protein